MKKSFSTVFTLVLLAFGLYGQRTETLFGKSGLHVTGIWGGANFGMTQLGQDNISTRGGFIGLEFNRVLFAGINSEKTNGSFQLEDRNGTSYSLNHKGVLIALVPAADKAIHPLVSFQLGGGEVKSEDGQQDNVFVVQPTVGLELNILRWFKTSLEGGYRFVSGTQLERLSDEELSSFFVNAKLKFGLSWGRD